jgi:hypothetical protein
MRPFSLQCSHSRFNAAILASAQPFPNKIINLHFSYNLLTSVPSFSVQHYHSHFCAVLISALSFSFQRCPSHFSAVLLISALSFSFQRCPSHFSAVLLAEVQPYSLGWGHTRLDVAAPAWVGVSLLKGQSHKILCIFSLSSSVNLYFKRGRLFVFNFA